MYRRKQRNEEKKPKGMTVTVRNGDVNGALRVLKKKLIKEGVFQELRESTYYESRGTKRRKAKRSMQLVGTNVRCRSDLKNLVIKR